MCHWGSNLIHLMAVRATHKEYEILAQWILRSDTTNEFGDESRYEIIWQEFGLAKQRIK